MVLHLPGEADTRRLGCRIGRALASGGIVAIEGPLGAGKTTLAKGIAEAFGIPPDEVTSPTFVIQHIYAGTRTVVHLDAYRLRSGAELEELGFEEMAAGGNIVVVEWADRVADALPPDALRVVLRHAPSGRTAEVGPQQLLEP
jgi:tRNA threonylcarbamoyl adenosine modification protein YjeE